MSLQSPLVPAGSSDSSTPWWMTVVQGPDQLRQRVAFALSEIFVISGQAGPLVGDYAPILAYEDLLANGAFGNFRDLLDAISHSAQMGAYLTYYKNQKTDPKTGVHPDENYAREVMQLFTVGLTKLNPDGTEQLDAKGNPVPTYALADVENLARVFTGWGSNPIPPHTIDNPQTWQNDFDLLHPLACYPNYHDTDAKTIIGGVVIPAGGTCESDMKVALDTLFHHPNVGPFIGKQLIQRLVTSNPSPGYVGRVAAAFDDDGTGVRGNLLAVIEAVLTDVEARKAGMAAKLREPILFFTNLYRAFSATDMNDGKVAEYQLVENGYNLYDEQAYYSPTVFNFFRPDYRPAGPLLTAGLVGPEFQILNEATIVNIVNQLEPSIYQYVDSAGTVYSGQDNYKTPLAGASVLLKTAQWEPFASDPGTLLDKLGLVFMQGAMPAPMRTTILDYITPIVSGTNGSNMGTSPTAVAAQRVIDATFLVLSSPQYAIQR